MHVLGDVDHQLQHAQVPLVLQNVPDKLHVQLQGVDGQGGEHVQGGVAGAEIIHLHPEAEAPEVGHGADDLVGILRVGGLRDLQEVVRGVQAVVQHQGPEFAHQVGVVEVDAGHVDGNREGDVECLLPAVHLGGRLLPDVLVQPLDQPVFLKEGDEDAGADGAQLRVHPPHQGLGAGETGGLAADVELRLVEDLELVLPEGALHVL